MLITTTLLASMTLTAPGLEWHQGDLSSALAEANAHERPAVVYFWRNGSEYCARFFQESLSHERVVEAMSASVLVSAQHGTDAGNALFERYHVTNLPTLLFLKPDGKPDDIVAGFADGDTLAYELERIYGGELTVTDLEKRIAHAEPGSEEQLDARFRLAVKHKDFGDVEAYVSALESIRDDDRRGRTLNGCRAMFHLVEHEISEAADGDVEKLELDPLRKVVRRLKHDEGRFEALDLLASLERYQGDLTQACKTWRKASEVVPGEQAMRWCANVAYRIMHAEAELTSKEKKLAVDLALRAADLASLEEPCGCEAECDCTPPQKKHASYLATLARAYDFAGEAQLATATAARALELDPSDDMRASVAELL